MMLSFLEQYLKAVDLDEECFNYSFPQGFQRSDFLLFDEICICEFKSLCNFDIRKKIENVTRKEYTTENNLKRNIYNTIEKKLSKANKQIRETKKLLKKPEALGLIIIENHIPKDISVLSLLDAANRKMENGLDSTDGILCLDFINTIVNNDGSHSHLAQLALPEKKETKKTKKLYGLVEILMTDFCMFKETPIYSGHEGGEIEQHWSINSNGQLQYSGKINLKVE